MTQETQHKITKWFWTLFAGVIALGVLVILLVALFVDIPSFEELENPNSKLATQVISEDGVVLATFHIENRTYVTYDELSPHLVHAAIATEDARFLDHSGIDLKSLGRVAFKTLLMRDSGQGGGSTITQQLAKTLYPRPEERPGKLKMIGIKIKEWITAVKLEKSYTKEEIMAMYLNSIFFGSGAYGVKTASETFFAKSPSDLTVEESAMLVGMVNKPTRYNPVINPEFALERRNTVISRMAKQGYISKSQRDSIQALPIVLNYSLQDHNSGLAPYFRDMLKRDMNAKKPKRSGYSWPEEYSADSLRWELDPIYGWLEKNRKSDGSRYDLDRDGLRIYTTINSHMQKYAEEAVAEHLGKTLQRKFDREISRRRDKPFAEGTDSKQIATIMNQARKSCPRYTNARRAGLSESEAMAQFSKPAKMRLFSWNSKGYVDTTMTPDDSIRYCKAFLRAAFVAIEPHSGNVKAYIGGHNYRYFKYDNVRQGRRQVGSTVKPFLYTLAFQEGLQPCDKVVCMPQTFQMFDGTTWTPRSTDKEEWIGTTVTLKWGLAKSSNNISAFLMKQVGPEALVRMMHQMGVTSHIDAVLSNCVGALEVQIYNMVASYNTFPSNGVFTHPQYISRIEDSNGKVITNVSTNKREAISPGLAYTMIKMMQGVVNEGTAFRLRSVYGFQGEIAGKTGTTNDNSDGWFIGYTPKITAGVWVGGENPQIHFRNLADGGGSNMALPIWGIWYKKCLADPALGFSGLETFKVPPGGASASFDCENSGTFLGGYGDDYQGDGGEVGVHDQEEDYYFN